MAAAPQRRRVKGDRAFRQLLNRMPEAMREEAISLLDKVGDDIAAAQQAEAPSRRIRAATGKRVYRATLRMRVGLVGRPINRRLFFARILEKGRKAQTVTVSRRGRAAIAAFGRRLSRGRKVAADVVSVYQLRVRSMAARPFIYSARVRALRASLGGRIEAFWNGALRRAAEGVSDD